GRRTDVIAAFQPYNALFCAGQPLRAPWVCVTGEDPRRFGDTSRVPGAVLKAGVRRAPLRTAPTRGLVDCYRDLGFGRDRWTVVANAVDPAAFAATAGAPDRSNAPRAGVLWVGRLVREKDPVLAVRVAARAGVALTVLGEGPLEREVR